MRISVDDLTDVMPKTASALCGDEQTINSDLQRMVGDPDDVRSSAFAQFKPNPGNLQLPNPLSPIEGDEQFFMYYWPGSVFQSHDGHQYIIEATEFNGRAEIVDRWYPRLRAEVSMYDIRRSIDQWVEPVQIPVPPPPPGVNYDAKPVRVVEGNTTSSPSQERTSQGTSSW